ncbi:MAG: response regulator, partial [Ignavibacteriales bacterium]|nr:response regulator [Ignavibacteriales bacterium]
MADLTPRDDIRKKVSEILKRVDQLIRAGEIDQSIREIIHAKEIDPKNVYIHAYEERLTFLSEEHQKHIAEEQTRKAAEEAARKRDQEALKRKQEQVIREEEERRRREEEQRRANEEQRRLEEERRAAEEQKRKSEEERRKAGEELRKLEEELRRAEEELRSKETDSGKTPSLQLATSQGSIPYRQALKEIWSDGAASSDEEARLEQLRSTLGISGEEHAKLEKEVKLETYYDALKRAWSSGAITPGSASKLGELRRTFQITPDEHDKIEAQMLWELRQGQERTSILVVDDDTKLLSVITETLQEASFNVKAFPTSDDAFTYLKENAPDIIISDINLETS